MNLRTGEEREPRQPLKWSLIWGLLALVVIAGVVLALVYGPRITPLLEAIS